MTNAHQLLELGVHLFRPAIVEARLMTAKQAKDAVYVATLAEELCGIEQKIQVREEALQVAAEAKREMTARRQEEHSAEWIRSKGRELDSRLRQVEKLEKRRDNAKDRLSPLSPQATFG